MRLSHEGLERGEQGEEWAGGRGVLSQHLQLLRSEGGLAAHLLVQAREALPRQQTLLIQTVPLRRQLVLLRPLYRVK